jgi:hypothetical protein
VAKIFKILGRVIYCPIVGNYVGLLGGVLLRTVSPEDMVDYCIIRWFFAGGQVSFRTMLAQFVEDNGN